MRTEFSTRDPEVAVGLLERVYATRLRLASEIGPVRNTHIGLGPLFVDDWAFEAAVSGEIDGMAVFAISELVAGEGRMRWNGEPHAVGPGSVVPLSAPDQPCRAAVSAHRQRVVSLDPDVVHRAARDRGAVQLKGDLRFAHPTPMPDEGARTWHALVDFLWRVGSTNPDMVGQPLAAASIARLAAHTTLSLFPNGTWADPTETELARDSLDGGSGAVRRAIVFIEGAADTDLTLADIAAAAHVTPRALQYGFRRLLDTTPMGYLRRVRLQHVRAELQSAGVGVTVAEVAGRWGFFNLGRFAAYYRSEFGENPAQTLSG